MILDIVWNHIRSSSPIWQIQPDYVLNPYIKIHNELNPNETEGSWGMLDWDHFNSKTIEYINKVSPKFLYIDTIRKKNYEYLIKSLNSDNTNKMSIGPLNSSE